MLSQTRNYCPHHDVSGIEQMCHHRYCGHSGEQEEDVRGQHTLVLSLNAIAIAYWATTVFPADVWAATRTESPASNAFMAVH